MQLKEMNLSLQQKIDSHICMIVVATDSNDPTEKLTRVRIELHISENELEKKKTDLYNVAKIIKATEHELFMTKEIAEKYIRDFHVTQ